ncbi:hypothetical protein NQ314_006029 [Rhamnusium bicolor]|uniref:Uncharacterized protein n=1 Tax=Rhamnusium bicolor TaxID=1586634 RepID=A0AAV8Z922_9CUCU|nr:hypothetical protein NQ314_006029 [Rhamnusium bicolor]
MIMSPHKTDEPIEVKNEEIIFYNDNISEDEDCSFENNKNFMEKSQEGTEESVHLEKFILFSNQLIDYQNAVNLETNSCNICSECFSTKNVIKKPYEQRSQS